MQPPNNLIEMHSDPLKQFHQFDLYATSSVATACIVALVSFWVMFILQRNVRWLVACIPTWLLYITVKTYESQLRTQLHDPLQAQYDAMKRAMDPNRKSVVFDMIRKAYAEGKNKGE